MSKKHKKVNSLCHNEWTQAKEKFNLIYLLPKVLNDEVLVFDYFGEINENNAQEVLTIDIISTYYNNFKLLIDCTSNEILNKSDMDLIYDFIVTSELYINMICSCSSYKATDILELGTNGSINYIKPFELYQENVSIATDKLTYEIHSYHKDDMSRLYVFNKNGEKILKKDTNLIKLHKTNKDELLKKFDLLMTFI